MDNRQRNPELIFGGLVRSLESSKVTEAGTRQHEKRFHGSATAKHHGPGAIKRKTKRNEQDNEKSETHRFLRRAADRGAKNSNGQRKEKGIHRHKGHAAKFAQRYAAHEEGDGQHRHHCQNSVKPIERSGG